VLQSLILIDALFSACWEKKKREREKEKWWWGVSFFPQGWKCLAGCAMWDICHNVHFNKT
jgi:hypothetical protein